MPAAVLILGVDTPIGLTLIRELGEHGVPVYGIAHGPASVGLASKYLTRGFIHQGDDGQLLNLINEIAETFNVAYLMTVSEQRILFLQNSQDRLKNIKALVPSVACMAAVLNKDKIYALARGLGIATPIDHDPARLDAIDRYPVILKWANPAEIAALLAEKKIPFLKCEYCYDRTQLQAALERYRPIGRLPLLQSYCRGYGLGHMFYMYQNQPVLSFQHKRIHEWPPEGGFSSLCESVDLNRHRALREKSVKLLQAIGWEGPAMVEYRYDEATDEAVLMEINGRFWGSLPLAYHAGAHFAWSHYAVQVIGRPPPQPVLRYGIRCMFFIPEIKRLGRILWARDKIQDKTLVFSVWRELSEFALHFLRGQFFYVFQWRDPKPWLLDCWFAGTARFRR